MDTATLPRCGGLARHGSKSAMGLVARLSLQPRLARAEHPPRGFRPERGRAWQACSVVAEGEAARAAANARQAE